MAEKITADMSTMDMIMVMSEGNPGAMSVLINMFQDFEGITGILACDRLDIRGSKLYMLNNDCCRRDTKLFYLTIKMLNKGVFSYDEIHANLGMVRAIPFIDENILQEYGDTVISSYENWNEFCSRCRESFIKRFESFGQGTPKRI